MDVNFNYTEPGKVMPVYFEGIFAEKPGGGRVANPSYDVLPSTAVAKNSDGLYEPIKAYRLYAAVTADDTTIKLAKGSGVAVGDIIGYGTKAVACTAVDTATSEEYDTVTVTLGVAIAADTVLYEAAAAKATGAKPKYTPAFVTNGIAFAGKGDQLVALVNGANIRKETANIADEVAALLPTINLV